MDKRGSYCCFLCPSRDFTQKLLTDCCPKCGNPYGFPLQSPPSSVGQFQILKPIGRGFYSATFLAQSGVLGRNNVLKVVPKSVYAFFGKDFGRECQDHFDLSQESEHIVGIETYFDDHIAFGNISLECWIAVLEYIEGESLGDFLTSSVSKEPRELAQIAIDLFRILGELDAKLKRHNDLHGENLIVHSLSRGRRAEAIADWIKVYLIDLGSAADESKSDGIQRFWDRHWVAKHLERMVLGLLDNPDDIEPLNYRLATTLARHIRWLYPSEPKTRQVQPEEAIEQIRMGIGNVASPWRETRKKFRRLSDTYNAQSLDPWFVPSLIVDPDGQWEKKISAHGPQIITGMRGCGKTLFLKSLHLHARATQRNDENNNAIISRLIDEGYVGLYASAASLLTKPGGKPERPINPFERLFVLYVKDAMYAFRHLHEIDADQVIPNYYARLANIVINCLGGPSDLEFVKSDFDLEIRLEKLILQLERPDCDLTITNPIESFSLLADTLRSLAPCWNNSQILYLLDDLSTRYLSLESIGELVSSLLFHKANCAFKITTERQTYEEILRSPGLIERARAGRDYEIFDLGAEVYERTHKVKRNKEKSFVEEVLEKRIQYFEGHPPVSPAGLLGYRNLSSIARTITGSSANSRALKSVYSGITALSKICVGDIGDVILIYEEILRKAIGKTPPIDPEIQTNAILNISSDRLWRLDRRDSSLKDWAKSFADASHALLVKSQNGSNKNERLRQYYGIYVRLTTGNREEQFKKLRELIDAGVFVFQGGRPRTKTRDADPSLQFKLVFRKLYGLSSYIGLSDRDRFELSGEDLEDWLNHPERGKEILLRNLGGPGTEKEDEEWTEEDDIEVDAESLEFKKEQNQEYLFPEYTIGECFSNGFSEETIDLSLPELKIRSIDRDSLSKVYFDYVVLGLGFEDRAVESTKRIFDHVRSESALLVRYDEPGKSEQITDYVKRKLSKLSYINYTDILENLMELPQGNLLIDITGLAKPAIFRFVRRALLQNQVVWVCRTQAERYYPKGEAIQEVFDVGEGKTRYDLLKAAEGVLTGESGPYQLVNLYTSGESEGRRRTICAFSSPKHGRLMKLLEERGYDRAELVSHPPVTSRGKLALLAAEIASDDYRGSNVTQIPSDDVTNVLEFIFTRFKYWFVERGFNFEVGLTGSKIQTFACAAASSVLQFTNVWYVSPRQFDPKKFTEGVGDTAVFEVRLSRNE